MKTTSEFKACRGCFVLKSIKNFSRRSSHKDGLDYYCYYCKRKFETIRRYKIDFSDFEIMRNLQQGKCKICNISANPLHIDHNHKNGKVRGLLCSKCNKGIGMFKDSIITLEAAIFYLKN